jgi:hypothetical protein
MTKRFAIFALLLPTVPLYGQDKNPATLRELLLAELRTAHDKADWFVPANTAMKGLTAERANWNDGKGNHSVGRLAHHLVFWNRWSLERLKGSTGRYTGTNDETFYKFDAKTWNDTVRELDEGMNEIGKWVETADEAKLKESAQTVTLICTHNAYSFTTDFTWARTLLSFTCQFELWSWSSESGKPVIPDFQEEHIMTGTTTDSSAGSFLPPVFRRPVPPHKRAHPEPRKRNPRRRAWSSWPTQISSILVREKVTQWSCCPVGA